MLKVSFKGATDSMGAPLNTAPPLGSPDDYIFGVQFAGGVNASASIKLDFVNGKAKATVDLSSVLTGDTAVAVISSVLFTAPLVPGDCPGTNSPSGVTARLDAMGCFTGRRVAIVGLLPGQ